MHIHAYIHVPISDDFCCKASFALSSVFWACMYVFMYSCSVYMGEGLPLSQVRLISWYILPAESQHTQRHTWNPIAADGWFGTLTDYTCSSVFSAASILRCQSSILRFCCCACSWSFVTLSWDASRSFDNWSMARSADDKSTSLPNNQDIFWSEEPPLSLSQPIKPFNQTIPPTRRKKNGKTCAL